MYSHILVSVMWSAIGGLIWPLDANVIICTCEMLLIGMMNIAGAVGIISLFCKSTV